MPLKFNRTFYYIAVLFFVSALQGCSSRLVILKHDCFEINWLERGRQDGMQGQPSNTWTLHSKSCSNMSTTLIQEYTDGWNTGLSLFCTEDHGFMIARNGQTYRKTCPDKFESAFLTGYKKGVEAFLIEKETSKIIAQLQEINNKLKSKENLQLNKKKLIKDRERLDAKKKTNLEALEQFNQSVTE